MIKLYMEWKGVHTRGHTVHPQASEAVEWRFHYIDVIMGAMASQITSPTIVYSSVYSGADQGKHHYNDVIMTTKAPQITSLTVVYSTVYSDADQRKHQISASLAFMWEIHRNRWIPRTKGQLRGKCFHLMTLSWKLHVTGLCVENSPVTGEFPAQKASNAENASIWWHHHAK